MCIRRQHVQRALFACSCAAFVSSLLLPAFMFERRESLLGYEALMWGWWGALTFDLGWFANIAYFYGIRAGYLDRQAHARVASVLALAIGLTSIRTKEWWFNEAAPTPILELGPAFNVWLLSFGLLLVWSSVSWESYEDAST